MVIEYIAYTLDQIDDIVKSQNLNCTCGAPIRLSRIHCYPHDGGVRVYGHAGKQWVYFHCPKCGYDWALWKLLNKALKAWTRGVELEALEKMKETL